MNNEQFLNPSLLLANAAGQLFFVCSGGGTDKTYLWKTLISKFKTPIEILENSHLFY